MLQKKRFNIRVYGIHLNKNSQLLVTDEYRLNSYMTKFPGGGLEFGEGTVDCLRRECKEELGTEIFNIEHFYTTDFFQPTTLVSKEPQQLLSIYYTFEMQEPYQFATTEEVFNFAPIDGSQTFRWVNILELSAEMFTFPIDKKVAEMIKKVF